MNKARKEAAKRKTVAQRAATRAKKLHGLMPLGGMPESSKEAPDTSLAQELFAEATSAIETAATDADYQSAIDLLRQAIRLNPGEAEYFVSLSLAYAHAEQHDFALAACEMALQLAPNHPVAADNKLKALKALGLPETTLIDPT